jgi:hypothetical protein
MNYEIQSNSAFAEHFLPLIRHTHHWASSLEAGAREPPSSHDDGLFICFQMSVVPLHR